MNGKVCCILGVCCPPGSAEQLDAFVVELMADGVTKERDEAAAVATWVLKHFDLAPAGSLAAFKADVAKMVKRG